MLNEQEPKISLQDYWRGFPEAPFSDSFRWVDADGFEHLTTVRGWGDKSLSEGISKAKVLIQYNGGKPTGNHNLPAAAAPQPDPAAKIAQEAGNKQMAQELQTQAEAVPAPPDGKLWQFYEADIVKVLPQPDDRVTIEFWGTGRKFPDLKVVKWKLDSANGLMKHVTSEPMSKAAEYKLRCRVYYTNGKEFEAGKFYKDVAHVRPL